MSITEQASNTSLEIHALIPARGGSKGIPRKNVQLYKNAPLITHSIRLAKQSKYITKTVVSTDCQEIRSISIFEGADVPFMRPSEIAQDLSTDYEYTKHYLEWCKTSNNTIPDILVQLRPTYPNRTLQLLNDTIETFIKQRDTYTSLRTVIPIDKSAFKMYTIENTNVLTPIRTEYKTLIEPYNRCRQELPQTYLHNGCIDIVNSSTILVHHSITGSKIYPYVMSSTDSHDIDTPEDLKRSENSS